MAKDFFVDRQLLLQKQLSLNLSKADQLEKVAMALDSSSRIKIIRLLTKQSCTIWEIAEKLNISLSTASFHVKLLKDANIVNITHNPSKKGNEKIVALQNHSIEILFNDSSSEGKDKLHKFYNVEIPIGSFTSFDIVAPCGIADGNGTLIGPEAQPDIFYSHHRMSGEIIWFTQGFLEYNIPNTEYKDKILESIEISLEICSECANYNNTYKSDIMFKLNDAELGVYTSPGDFGGRKGNYTPTSWPEGSTQFGKLLQIRIDNKGCFFNHININNELNINSFQYITKEKCMKLSFGVEKNSKYVGGLNLFGSHFGDYNQAIRIKIIYY